MRYSYCEKTGDKLSALGFGCMRFARKGLGVDMDAARRLVTAAVEKGVNYFDTAYVYPGSEAALGEALQGVRDKVFIADKLPVIICGSPTDFDKFLGRQLERLKTDHIDYYLMHMLTDTQTWDKLRAFGIEAWLEKQKSRGVIRHVGFSFHGAQHEFLNLLDVYDWDFCQIQYNYIDANNQAGHTGLLKAASKGMPVIVMEPLLGGRLVNGLPKAVEAIFREERPEYSFAEWALRWLWDQSDVSVVLSGMNGAEQLDENARVANASAPGILTSREREVFRLVRDEFNAVFKVRCTACRYCLPCPRGVDIPTCFAAYNTCFIINKSTGFKQYIQNTGVLSSVRHCASLCVSCGKCELRCPQRIPIPQTLKEVSKIMEPFWFKPLAAVARAIASAGGKH
jgi:predicted aldo/keto reductase-like oxidoreductase